MSGISLKETETYRFLSQNGMNLDSFIFEHFSHVFASYQITLHNTTAALRCVLILQTLILNTSNGITKKIDTIQ